MRYYSLNRQSPPVDFREATLRGLAPDKGLYFPEYIPRLDNEFIQSIESFTNEEIAYRVIEPYVSGIPETELRNIVAQTISFPIPLKQVTDRMFVLELFHGPTLAFKDVGARFMSRCLGYFSRERKQNIIVLVATSGDTGGAVADGFHGVDGVEVVILYPSGKVSAVQEKQLTTHGNNVHALEVNGTFDDCQLLVKTAFADTTLNGRLTLTSANSINVARWLPQQFYYFLAWKQWPEKSNPPVLCVPSGNFGNICAGMLANKSGLPARHFIAACNSNDTVPAFLSTGKYQPKKATATISNAMDVGDPSNFVRIMELFENNFDDVAQHLSSYSISDEETREAIAEAYNSHSYLLDPHGAVAYHALKDYLNLHLNERGIFLETAHPVKFYDAVEPVIHHPVPLPDAIAEIMHKEKRAVFLAARYDALKEFLLAV